VALAMLTAGLGGMRAPELRIDAGTSGDGGCGGAECAATGDTGDAASYGIVPSEL
jgi:hypothetical protein